MTALGKNTPVPIMRILGICLWILARQIPHDHPSMGRLVEVVVAVKNDQIRTTLEMLDAELLEFSDQPTYDQRIPTPTQTTEWINLTSFMARLLGHELVNITYIAIWEFRDALEREPWRDMHPERLDCYVGAMAEWIKYGGCVIYEYFEGRDEDDDSWKRPLYRGQDEE